MTPVGATLMLVLIAVILAGSRRTALLGFAAGILYLHQGLSFDILGVNLYAHRFLELAGMGRIIVRNELTISKLNKIDKTFLSLFFYTTIVYILRSSDGVTAHVGDFVDATFTYLTFRGLIDNIDDFKWFLNRFAILLVPYVLLAAVEMIMRQNPFAIVGANPWILQFRQGIPRCTASFRHAITFGSLGASFFPIYVGHFFAAKNKIPGLIGVGCCMGVVALSNSGGPLSALIIGELVGHFGTLETI